MAKQKKLEKTAQKAYDHAKDAVKAAEKAAAKVTSKKRRPAAADLKQNLKQVKTTLQTPKKSAEKAPAKKSPTSTDVYTPPLPATPTGADAATDLHAQTVIALRRIAKSKGLKNITRLNKAGLIETIENA